MSDYSVLFKERKEYANGIIKTYLPVKEGYLTDLFSAMEYSVWAGGKRLRPVLIDIIYKMFGGTDKRQEPLMAAMEYLHTYSLVHDDMPAIDNDDMRRGKPSTHKKFGEACGLLAGDGLLHWAFQTALTAFSFCKTDADKDSVIRAARIFADKSGPYGMLGGQAADVLFTAKNPDRERLEYIYKLKTCALIEGSMMIGAALAGADNDTIASVERIGRCIGLAFQIQDDILDCCGDEKMLGKAVGSDEKNKKTTYVTLFGVEKAGQEVERLSKEASDKTAGLACENEGERQFLLWLIDSLAGREA